MSRRHGVLLTAGSYGMPAEVKPE